MDQLKIQNYKTFRKKSEIFQDLGLDKEFLDLIPKLDP